jgi:hypothetical protein
VHQFILVNASDNDLAGAGGGLHRRMLHRSFEMEYWQGGSKCSYGSRQLLRFRFFGSCPLE